LSVKLPEAKDRIGLLKAQYDEAWQLAADEDREKAAIRFVQRRMYIT
jgi:ethanolamine utilization microcompartment shell protein EutL